MDDYQERRARALILFGACLVSKAVRDTTDDLRIAETDVRCAVREMREVDRGERKADDMPAVDALLRSCGVRTVPGTARVGALQAAVEGDHRARVRRRLAYHYAAPLVVPVDDEMRKEAGSL